MQKTKEGWLLDETFGSEHNKEVTDRVGDYVWLNLEAVVNAHPRDFSVIETFNVKREIKEKMCTHFTYLKQTKSTSTKNPLCQPRQSREGQVPEPVKSRRENRMSRIRHVSIQPFYKLHYTKKKKYPLET